MKIILRKLIREPLFHFVLLGAVIFLLAGRVRSGSVGSGDKIVVTQRALLLALVVLGCVRRVRRNCKGW